MSEQIVVTAGPDKGRSFPLLAGEPLQVGRSKSTSTQLTDPTVSRVHCEIEWDGARVTVHNISDNGTLINGVRVTEAQLTPRDVIRIGETELRLLSGSEEPTTLAPAGEKKPVAAEPLVNLVGKTLSNYAIEAMIAKGASSVIFRARDTTDDSPVALKVLQPEFATNDEDVQRFIRAMKTVLGLRHPNLVSLHKAGKTGNYCWLAMDLVEGESMAQVIRRLGVANMLDWRYGYRVAVHIARALEYAHEQSIIHRNVTPQNILWRSADKMVLLGDLMLAKALEGSLAHQITRPGELLGDVAYMAPERTRGVADADGRSDLYGLGATVYALVAGRPPFAEGSLPELITKIRTAEPDKPKKYQMAIPDMFQGTVLRLLAKRPEDRFQTATEVLADLDRVGKFAGVSA
jgi:serine/threonine-protein kinase